MKGKIEHMMEAVNILGVNISRAGVDEAAAVIEKMIQTDGFHYAFTPNSEMVMYAYKNPDFARILNSATINTADGIGVVYAAKVFGSPTNGRAAGFDIAKKLMGMMAQKGYTLYLFGSSPGVAEQARENLCKEYKNLKIVGVHDGYFSDEKEKNIISDINSKKPDVLFVCLGSPRQEKWIYEHRQQLNAKLAMGLGGCLDVFAGNVKRAPDIFIKLGLEWLYRLIKEPKRLFRMLALPRFMLTVILKKISGGKNR